MMQFTVKPPSCNLPFKIKHKDALCFIGSCFSDTLSHYFLERKFSVLANPHGIIYNPVSIAKSISSISHQSQPDNSLIVENDSFYSSYDYHSSIQGNSQEELIANVEKINQSSRNWLQKTDVVFITLGTAWVQIFKKNKEVVANNLKQPADLFDQKLLTLSEINDSITSIHLAILDCNPKCKIVFTVSPVRHLRNGLIENNRSKARLLEAIHGACDTLKNVFYFPSYELVLDVLRDYRFFKKDMAHPNEQSTDYVWEYILENLVEPTDYEVIQRLYNLWLACQHRLMNPEGEHAQKFIQNQLAHVKDLENNFSYLNLKEERNYFENL